MDAGIVGLGNIGATSAPCLEFSAHLSNLGRADERTRTADLLISSVRSDVSGRCTDLQIPHEQLVLCSLPCPLLQGSAFGLGSN